MLFLLFLFQASLAIRNMNPTTCLLSGLLYHPPTNTCTTPLARGPCAGGEVVVLGREPGVGECQEEVVCGDGEAPVLSLQGGVVCVCSRAHCNTLYTRGQCGQGQVLLPSNYQLHRQECPQSFSCKRSRSCRGFKMTRAELAPRETEERQEQIDYLETMVCHKKSRSVCCPDYDKESLLSQATLLASMISPGPRCTDNPCPGDTWPWRGEDGVAVCLPHEGAGECHGELVERDGRLVCPIFTVKSVAPVFRRNCGRRRRWLRGRCVRIFW